MKVSKVSQNSVWGNWWGRLTSGFGGEQQKSWDELGFRLYVLRWLIFGVNLIFGIFWQQLASEMLLFYLVVFVMVLGAAEWLRRRISIQAVHALLMPSDVLFISLSVITSGGLDSDVYLLYIIEVIIMTLYLGGAAGLLLSSFSMIVYGFILYHVVESSQDLWQSFYRMTMILMLAVALTYVGAQLRQQIMRNRQMAEDNRRLACTDPLTGLGNSRVFYQRLDQLLAEYATKGKPFSLLMFDCDNLKSVNDHHGHEAGDLLIREIALTGQQIFEPFGEVMRYAGDEFYALFDQCGPATAVTMAEQFVQQIGERSIDYKGVTIRTTASAGLILFHAGAEGTRAEISRSGAIRMVDHALYESKNSGKARLTCHAVTDEGQ